MDGGPNGVHKQNRARGASSVFLFWPFRTLSFPLMSNRCKEKKNKYHYVPVSQKRAKKLQELLVQIFVFS